VAKTRATTLPLSREISTREGKLRYINKRLPGNKKLLPSRKNRDIPTVQGEISSLQSSVIELTGKLEELAALAEHIATYEVYRHKLKSLEKAQISKGRLRIRTLRRQRRN